MRKLFSALVLVSILIAGCDDPIEVETSLTSYKELIKYFQEIPNTYRTVPFWVWNTEMTKPLIDKQLEDYASKGFGGVFIHPRYGLITEYGGEEWYDLTAYAVRKAKKLDLDIWLYDENSFPSGFAGGLVPAEMPESYNEGHALRMQRLNELSPEKLKDILHAYKVDDGKLLEISDNIEDFMGVSGQYLVYEKVYFPVRDWYAGFSYVDLLKPGVTEKFIEVTMEGYEERFMIDFGGRVPGVFTDEPNIAPQGSGQLIRWTPDLFDRFSERWGYRLEPRMHALLEETPYSKQVRHNYFQLLLELFIERWSKPWYNYTEEVNLSWTGHYWEHGWPSPHHGPDHMAMYAWHQIPGVDMLFNNWKIRPDQFGNVRAVRELNSVGNQMGRVRKLSETYGASGWELTFEDMKRNGDWQYVMGVNLMNQHLSYQSLAGDRKHDFPQSFSYHVPYWDEYPILNDYYARLSLSLAAGQQVSQVLVLEPTTSAWMFYTPSGENEHLGLLKNAFTKLLDLLEHEQVEYDLGSENIIRDHGSTADGNFIVGERAYRYLLFPEYLQNMNEETFHLVNQYLSEGGVIISLGEPPSHINGVPDNRCELWPTDYSDQWLRVSTLGDPRLIESLRNQDFIFVETKGDSLFHMRRVLEEGQLLFFTNSAKVGESSIRLNMSGKEVVELDLFDGHAYNYPAVNAEGVLSFKVSLPPAGSKLLFVSDKKLGGGNRKLRNWRGEDKAVTMDPITVKALGENALNLDYCKLVLDSDTTDLNYFYDAQTEVFQAHGFEKNPWVSASQYKTEIVDQDTFRAGSGFTAIYPFFVDSEFRTKDLRLVVERPHLYKVSINGIPLDSEDGAHWLDTDFGVFRITEGIDPGENEIVVKADPMSVFCELEPVYLVGDFDVLPLDKGWLLASPTERTVGSWKELGMPFYSGNMQYETHITLDEKEPVKIVLGEWAGTVARVDVNGQEAGHIFYLPYELRLDKFVKKGDNTVTITIFGSLKNLLGPHHNVNRRGIVTPWSFKYAPEVQPPGNKYDLLDYGLFEPFKIYTLL